MRYFRIFLSIFIVLSVAFFVVRGCVRRERPPLEQFPAPPAPVRVAPKKVPPPVAKEARMAVILDDWGNNLALVQSAVEIKRPLTLSVLPRLKRSRAIAEEAHRRGLGVMLHLPMQPENAKKRLEPKTILTTTPDPEVVLDIDEALEDVPYAEGVNNHMGSAATSDPRVMITVLTHLHERGLFFVDSNTASTTVGPQVAKRVGIPFAKRDVFLDNELAVAPIKSRLVAAARIALKKGRVVVIGHDKKITLSVLKEMAPALEKAGVRFVFVKELLEK